MLPQRAAAPQQHAVFAKVDAGGDEEGAGRRAGEAPGVAEVGQGGDGQVAAGRVAAFRLGDVMWLGEKRVSCLYASPMLPHQRRP
jgi:hypothetical protein